MKQLVILAGGKGSRLQERLGNLPKPLIDIAGTPLLERQILLAKEQGFTHLIITVCYQAQAIRDYCGDGSRYGLQIDYLEEEKPLGTAGAILANLDRFADTFMVMYGDTMLKVDLESFWKTHQEEGAEASLFLHPNDHPHDSDLVEIDNLNRIIAFHPYPHPEGQSYANLVNAALYVVQKEELRPWTQLLEKGSIDFVKELFPKMLANKQKLLGYNSIEYIKDAGTPKRVDQVVQDLQSGKVEKRSLSKLKSAIFLDRDGTLTEELAYVSRPEQIRLIPNAAQGLRRINQSGAIAVLTTNQPVVARGACTENELQQIHNRLETLLGQEGAFLDAIYYCPHHPDKGFAGEVEALKIRCDCRKPAKGMIEAAGAKYNIDLSQSWLIGDSSVDMLCAKNAGVKSILVRTGFSGCDDKYAARPDFEAFDLGSACNFIFDKFPGLMEQARQQTSQIKAGERVVIGGLARSGKSTWASLVKLALAERQIPATIISLDGWIKDLDKRPEGNVLSRHDLDKLAALIKQLKTINQPLQVELPSYNRKKRGPNQQVESVEIQPGQVLIFEGVIAFLVEELLKGSQHQFFIKPSGSLRLENFQKEYRLRGFGEDEIVELYQQREQDENNVILDNAKTLNAILIEEQG